MIALYARRYRREIQDCTGLERLELIFPLSLPSATLSSSVSFSSVPSCPFSPALTSLCGTAEKAETLDLGPMDGACLRRTALPPLRSIAVSLRLRSAGLPRLYRTRPPRLCLVLLASSRALEHQ